MPGEISTRIPSRGDHSKGLAGPPASRGVFFPPQASSVLAAERTWALRLRRVPDTPKRDDASDVVVVSVYKAVNKAAPSKGSSRIATLVIRRPSGADDEGDVTMGHAKDPVAPVHRPGWTVAFSSFGDTAPAMDRVHGPYLYVGLYLYCAPHLLLRRHVVTLFGRKRSKTHIKGGGAHPCKGFGFLAIVATSSLTKLSLYCVLLQAVQYTKSRT